MANKIIQPEPGKHVLFVDGEFAMIGDIEQHLMFEVHKRYEREPQRQYVIAEIMMVGHAGPIRIHTHASKRMA